MESKTYYRLVLFNNKVKWKLFCEDENEFDVIVLTSKKFETKEDLIDYVKDCMNKKWFRKKLDLVLKQLLIDFLKENINYKSTYTHYLDTIYPL